MQLLINLARILYLNFSGCASMESFFNKKEEFKLCRGCGIFPSTVFVLLFNKSSTPQQNTEKWEISEKLKISSERIWWNE